MQATPPSAAAGALERGDWHEALARLRAGDPASAGDDVGLRLLARAAYGAGHLEEAVGALEDLHALHLVRDEAGPAADAAATVAMYLMMDTGLMAPVRGWLARAQALLDPDRATATHALVSMVRAYERFMSGALDEVVPAAERAVELGRDLEVGPALALGSTARARVSILRGDLADGLARLDDVAGMLLAGAFDALTTGMVWCELVCAAHGVGLHDRVVAWTEAMQRWGAEAAIGGIRGRCRIHRAQLLRLRGHLEPAEEQARRACEELRPWMRREFGWPLTELGDVLLLRGDLNGAEEAFLAAHRSAWQPQPGLALLRLAQGRVAAAADLVRAALEHPVEIPWKERPPVGPLRRVPLLDARVEIAVAAEQPDVAASAAEELQDAALTWPGTSLGALADLAAGRVAVLAGDHDTAVARAGAAVAAWGELGAPHRVAAARAVLATAHERAGSTACAELERGAAHAAFDALGVPRWRPGELTRPVGQPGRDAGGTERDEATAARAGSAGPDARGQGGADDVFRCEGDTRTVSFAGRTVLLRDLKGMRYLERLLEAPGREFHALDLVAAEQGTGGGPGGARAGAQADRVGRDADAGPLIDDQAREAYRRRLRECEHDIEEAEALGDPERAARARADRDYLVEELARAVGLDGRQRRAGSRSERARTSVTRTLRYAQERIAEHHPELGEHLAACVRTGTYCAYEPDPRLPPDWRT